VLVTRSFALPKNGWEDVRLFWPCPHHFTTVVCRHSVGAHSRARNALQTYIDIFICQEVWQKMSGFFVSF
jgi:hypothetical protein